MPAIEPSPCIVVGYDGSASARAALRLAADSAELWGARGADEITEQTVEVRS